MHRVAEKEALLQDSYAGLQSVKQALGGSEAREQALLHDLDRGQKELDETKGKLHEVEQLLEEARKEIMLRIQK